MQEVDVVSTGGQPVGARPGEEPNVQADQPGVHQHAVAARQAIPPLSAPALQQVMAFEDEMRKLPQIDIRTHHVIHAGIYSRTICIPKGAALTGALVKIPTMLTIAGDVSVFTGEGNLRLRGYNVLPASALRKQAFFAHDDTFVTMSFRTEAKTVADAEREFTDDFEQLMSHTNDNDVVITGE